MTPRCSRAGARSASKGSRTRENFAQNAWRACFVAGVNGVIVVACRHVRDAFTAFRPIDAEQFRQGDGEPFADAWFYCGQSRSRRFHAALAVIDGVRPKDEIEAMLAAHMAVTNIALLELFARTRGARSSTLQSGRTPAGAALCEPPKISEPAVCAAAETSPRTSDPCRTNRHRKESAQR
jgi:hypothetical protein